jgi:hypothetical protein
MKKIIGKFFAKIRQTLFTARIEREIYHKIFPHLNQHADHGYPFGSKDEMVRLHIRSGLDAQMKFDMIERTAAKMPKAYGDAFRYIAYRDLNERMKMYLEIAAERVQPETCDPRFVARHAT